MVNKGGQKQAVPETVKSLEAEKRAISLASKASFVCHGCSS